MASNLISDSKMQYYPTQLIECFKMLPMVGTIILEHEQRQLLKENMGERWDILFKEYVTRSYRVGFDKYLYTYFLEKGEYNYIRKHFTFKLGDREDNQVFTVTDYFAGEGKWLELFKFINPNRKDIHLIANELETIKYNDINDNELINESYNLAFENLNLPKYHASLTLFNPPYGMTNGERNAKRYLRMLIDREYLHKDKKESSNGVMIAVLRGDDILECADILVKHFKISFRSIYKVNEEEYKKYKQFVLYAKLRSKPLGDSRYDITSQIEGVENLKRVIEDKKDSDIEQYNYNYDSSLTPVKYEEIKSNFDFIKSKNEFISNSKNKTWTWIKDITELKDISQKSLTLPRNPKVGELSLIISSGYINGNMNIEGVAKHIVIGGVKNLEQTEKEEKINNEGQKYTEFVTTRYTKPYLNLLINNNGKLEIKELGGE